MSLQEEIEKGEGKTLETAMEGRSEVRNRVIARVFKELGYIEQWGTGLVRIQTACREYHLPAPRFLENGDYVSVDLYRKNSDTEFTDTEEYRKSIGKYGIMRMNREVLPQGMFCKSSASKKPWRAEP